MVKYITAMRVLRASRLQLSFGDITNFKFGLQSPLPIIDAGDMTWDTGDLTASLMPLLLPVLRGRYFQLSRPPGYLARAFFFSSLLLGSEAPVSTLRKNGFD